MNRSENYNGAGSPETELRALIALLLDAISSDSVASAGAQAELAAIRKQVNGFTPGELSEATAKLSAWVQRWQSEIERRLNGLSPARRRNGAQNGAAVKPGTDPCTGLPARGEAEKAIKGDFGSRRPVWATVFILQRLPAINARFGRSVGDHMLVTAARHLARQLGETDLLFRWIGPSFVALMERPDAADVVRAEVNRICTARFHASVVLDSSTVLIPVSVKCHLLSSSDYSSATEFIGTLLTIVSDEREVTVPLASAAAAAPSPRAVGSGAEG